MLKKNAIIDNRKHSKLKINAFPKVVKWEVLLSLMLNVFET